MMISNRLSLHLVSFKYNPNRYIKSIYSKSPIVIKSKNQIHSQKSFKIGCISSKIKDVDMESLDPFIQELVNTYIQKSFKNKQKLSTLVPKIEYLVDLGISKEKMVSFLDKNYDALTNIGLKKISKFIPLFLELGFEKEKVVQLLSHYLPVIRLSESKLIKLHDLFIVRNGVTHDKFITMSLKCPYIFNTSYENNILPKINYLMEEVGLNESDVIKCLLRYPNILTTSLEKRIKPTYEFLKNDVGLEPSELQIILRNNIYILLYSVENFLIPKIEFLDSYLNIKRNEIGKIMKRSAGVFKISEEKLTNNIENLCNLLECDRSKLKRLVLARGNILIVNPEYATRKVDLLKNVLKRDIDELFTGSSFLMASFETIKYRFEALESLGINHKDYALSTIMNNSTQFNKMLEKHM